MDVIAFMIESADCSSHIFGSDLVFHKHPFKLQGGSLAHSSPDQLGEVYY